MDKNTTIGLLLIGLVLMAFLYLNKSPEKNTSNNAGQGETELVKKNDPIEQNTQLDKDSIYLKEISSLSDTIDQEIVKQLIEQKETADFIEKYGMFYNAGRGLDSTYYLVNDKIRVSISSQGAKISSVEMVELNEDGQYKYKTHKNKFIDSINEPLRLFEKETSEMSLRIIDDERNLPIQTKDLFFDLISQNDTSIVLRAKTDNKDQYLDFIYTLSDLEYDLDLMIDYHGIEDRIRVGQVDLDWSMLGLSTEKLANDERMICSIMYRYFKNTRDYLSERSDKEEELEGNLNWVAFKHKFFSSILISKDGISEGTLIQKQLDSDDYTIQYKADLTLPGQRRVPLKFYFGPNEYDLLSTYENEMEGIVNLGWGIFGWVNKIMIGPIFHFLKSWGIGFGLIILLLTLAVKIIIMPLTYKNYVSSAKMKVLKPEIAAINKKYEGKTDRDVAMKKQKETMTLYRQTGVNPMAGCIPVVIQMPILFAVFRYFPSSLDLRHQGFLWAEDLSSFDSILDLSFNIPFYGDHISLFTLLMAGSTLFYTMMNSNQMTPSQPGMPNMKVIMYMFPIMMIFFFNDFSSGLSYYYLCGNLMNMGIMWGIKKYMVDERKIRLQIEQNKRKPKKKSKFQQRMEEVAKQQQKKRK